MRFIYHIREMANRIWYFVACIWECVSCGIIWLTPLLSPDTTMRVCRCDRRRAEHMTLYSFEWYLRRSYSHTFQWIHLVAEDWFHTFRIFFLTVISLFPFCLPFWLDDDDSVCCNLFLTVFFFVSVRSNLLNCWFWLIEMCVGVACCVNRQMTHSSHICIRVWNDGDASAHIRYAWTANENEEVWTTLKQFWTQRNKINDIHVNSYKCANCSQETEKNEKINNDKRLWQANERKTGKKLNELLNRRKRTFAEENVFFSQFNSVRDVTHHIRWDPTWF